MNPWRINWQQIARLEVMKSRLRKRPVREEFIPKDFVPIDFDQPLPVDFVIRRTNELRQY